MIDYGQCGKVGLAMGGCPVRIKFGPILIP